MYCFISIFEGKTLNLPVMYYGKTRGRFKIKLILCSVFLSIEETEKTILYH